MGSQLEAAAGAEEEILQTKGAVTCARTFAKSTAGALTRHNTALHRRSQTDITARIHDDLRLGCSEIEEPNTGQSLRTLTVSVRHAPAPRSDCPKRAPHSQEIGGATTRGPWYPWPTLPQWGSSGMISYMRAWDVRDRPGYKKKRGK